MCVFRFARSSIPRVSISPCRNSSLANACGSRFRVQRWDKSGTTGFALAAPRTASIALTLVTAARFFDIAWRARTPLYIAHCLIYCIFLFSVPFFQYYEMSYGLNVEMHKQVSPARVHLNFKWTSSNRADRSRESYVYTSLSPSFLRTGCSTRIGKPSRSTAIFGVCL